jgi:hypothetical protein
MMMEGGWIWLRIVSKRVNIKTDLGEYFVRVGCEWKWLRILSTGGAGVSCAETSISSTVRLSLLGVCTPQQLF